MQGSVCGIDLPLGSRSSILSDPYLLTELIIKNAIAVRTIYIFFIVLLRVLVVVLSKGGASIWFSDHLCERLLGARQFAALEWTVAHGIFTLKYINVYILKYFYGYWYKVYDSGFVNCVQMADALQRWVQSKHYVVK